MHVPTSDMLTESCWSETICWLMSRIQWFPIISILRANVGHGPWLLPFPFPKQLYTNAKQVFWSYFSFLEAVKYEFSTEYKATSLRRWVLLNKEWEQGEKAKPCPQKFPRNGSGPWPGNSPACITPVKPAKLTFYTLVFIQQISTVW